MSDMQTEVEQRIRLRAYWLWRREGSPKGRADEHWRQACAADDARVAYGHRNDIEGADSFPASDPPSHTGITGEGRAKP